MSQTDYDVVVAGAGAAGLLAACRAAEMGRRTILLEKNQRPGIKILMSGGTRCNITHDTDNRGIVDAFGPAGRFLHSALASLSVDETIQLFEAEGVQTKVEETGKVFPVSNKAADVLDALLRRLKRSGAVLALGEPVLDLCSDASSIRVVTPSRVLSVPRIILTTGGRSYPGSGTTGDGYALAAKFGHTMVTPRPALVPITVNAPWVRELRGITLPDTAVRVLDGPKTLAARRGSLLFAHFGLSGPVILDVSRVASAHPHPQSLTLELDLLPALDDAHLADFLQNESINSAKKQLAVVLSTHLPRRLCDMVLTLAELPVDRKAASLSKAQRAALVRSIKALRLAVSGTLGFEKAEVTAGGILLDEVDSRTMQSKRLKQLFVAGEVLDLDGPIGGYNFQAAFSTGWLAGSSA